MDWRQLWEICPAPDNVPIVGLIPLLFFYVYLAWKQAKANDDLIAELESNPALAKTHHRKSWPFRAGWQKEIHVWPFLLRIEFLAAIKVMDQSIRMMVTMMAARNSMRSRNGQTWISFCQPARKGQLLRWWVLASAGLDSSSAIRSSLALACFHAR